MASITLETLLSTLKPRQLEAIKHTQSPQLILAGAGTGKTTTITAKIAYMVEKENVDPSQILALTFSKEAARNMREKVKNIRLDIINLLGSKKCPRVSQYGLIITWNE